uniref:C2H2-type domain-containing protein n=1 Tax=Anguilla anguilla TaxID=7936 RepID=A0A0E9W819_ANGAN
MPMKSPTRSQCGKCFFEMSALHLHKTLHAVEKSLHV